MNRAYNRRWIVASVRTVGGCKGWLREQLRARTVSPSASSSTPRYDMARRTRASSYGGIGLMHQPAQWVGVARRIDEGLNVIRQPQPYRN